MPHRKTAVTRSRELHEQGLDVLAIVTQLRAEGYDARPSWVERWTAPRTGKRGRPRKGVRHVVYLDDATDAAVRAEADRDGVSIEAVLVSAIRSGVEWHAPKRKRAAR